MIITGILNLRLYWMDIRRIDKRLRAAAAESAGRLHWFESVGSTNDHILHEVRDFHASVCLAAEQTTGRGRRGRRWESAPGQGIYLSLGWDLRGVSPEGLSLVCGLSVLDALREQDVSGVTLKWPNDVLLDNRKLAGILVELNRERCVIGIGLNVKLPETAAMDPGAVIPWTGLFEHGYDIDIDLLTATMIANLNRDLARFCREGFAPAVDRWNAVHAFHGADVEVDAGERVHGRVTGVDSRGALCLATGRGRRVFHAGEVSLKIPEPGRDGC